MRPGTPLYLFINSRPVDCAPIRRLLHCLYSTRLTRSSFLDTSHTTSATNANSPRGQGGLGVSGGVSSVLSGAQEACGDAWFVYLAIEMPAEHLDVNVHPSKSEVRFLHEELLLDAIEQVLSAHLQERAVHMHIRCALLLTSFHAVCPPSGLWADKAGTGHRNRQGLLPSLAHVLLFRPQGGISNRCWHRTLSFSILHSRPRITPS